MDSKKLIGLSISVILTLIAWFTPLESFGIPGLTIIEQRVIALFVFAACMWISEAIPIWTTSVLVLVLMLLTTSDSMFNFMRVDDPTFGTPIGNKALMASFADPTIMLFMGGFVLAITATKYKLDAALAKVMLAPFGTRSEFVLLGFLLVTGVFSMFMSNTATAAMMLAILTPVLSSLPANGKGKIALALAIPVAANIGGIGTPIGTPPNAIAKGNLENLLGINIGFGDWAMIMIPLALVILLIMWFVLIKLFPFSQKNIKIEIEGEFEKSPKAYIVYITFALTILLWVTDKLTGVNSNVVALIPFAVFSVCGIFTKEDLRLIDWDVLWLVAGGFALGIGLDKTGLAQHLVNAIPFNTWSPMVVILGSGLLCIVMSTFMSNSATAALLIPILAAVGSGMQQELLPYGGVKTLIIGLALSASFAMALPISTPPNALAYAKGFIQQKDMALVGIIVGVISMILGYTLLVFVGKMGLL
jgi:sodium-dependent dicarboxylate transporter 2/3/5